MSLLSKIREGKLDQTILGDEEELFTFLLADAEEQDDGAEDVDATDDARSDHVSVSLHLVRGWGIKKGKEKERNALVASQTLVPHEIFIYS